MSHQEMQFADPDWQPRSSRPGRAPVEQALAVPTGNKYTPTANPQGDEQAALPLRPPVQVQKTPTRVRHTSRRQRWLLGLLARVAVVVVWVSTPLITRAFHAGWILPLLGLLFLPVTTLTYTVVYALAGSVTGLGWLWVAGALLLDLASNVGRTNKRSGS